MEPIIRRIAIAAGEGFTPERGMIYEKNLVTGHLDADRHWWVQAETVVGYMNIYQYFEDKEALQKLLLAGSLSNLALSTGKR